MRRKTFSSRFQALASEKKIILGTAILTFISCFLPWYGINNLAVNEWWNVFNSIGSVAGYIISAFAVLQISLITAELVKPEWELKKKLPLQESTLYLFLNMQSCFVALIFIPVYAQYSLLNAASSGTRFGIYVALISTLAASVASLSYYRKLALNGEREEEFINVPRTQRSLQDFEESGQDSEFQAEEGPREQESMFQPSQSQDDSTSTYSERHHP